MATKEKIDVYGIVTERMIAMLEAGTCPWRKPWVGGTKGMPKNLKSGKAYRGANVFILLCQSYASPYWLTFKQAQEMGGTVRKGEKGTPVIFWNFFDDKRAPKGTTPKRLAFLKYYTVFNAAQCDGIEVPTVDAPVRNPVEAIEAAERIVGGFLDRGPINRNGNAAFYRPADDSVTVPAPETFANQAEFYSTLFHELGHSTGHSSRLDRTGISSPSFFGSHEYSKEELVAEMTAAFLCAEAGILMGTIENSASYLASWIKALKGDVKLLVGAAGEAQKAADHILRRKYEGDESAPEVVVTPQALMPHPVCDGCDQCD